MVSSSASKRNPAAQSPKAAGATPVVICGDLNLLRCFAGAGVPALVVSSDPSAVTFQSRYCSEKRVIADVKTSPVQALEDLLTLGAAIPQKPVLVYGDDAMLLLVSRNREILSRFYRFLLPPAELIEILVDKTRFGTFAAGLSIRVPGTLTSHETKSAEDLLARLALPMILKPAVHVGWHEFQARSNSPRRPSKALLAETPAQLRTHYNAIRDFTDDFVVQEYIPGGTADHYSFHAWFDETSAPLGHFVGRKIRTYPKESGHSTCLELVHEPELVQTGLDIMRKMNLQGPAKLDFKRDPRSGRYYLLEINPRYNLWHDLGAAAGVNLPYTAYRYLTGLDVAPQTRYDTRCKWLAFGDDVRTALRYYLPDGDLSWTGWLRSYLGPAVYEVFSWKDPYPWAVQFASALTRRSTFHALRRYFRHSRQS